MESVAQGSNLSRFSGAGIGPVLVVSRAAPTQPVKAQIARKEEGLPLREALKSLEVRWGR